MYSKTLVLCGPYRGQTVVLGKGGAFKFVDGKITLRGNPRQVEGLSKYLGLCYQALPEGSDELKQKQIKLKEIEVGECDSKTSEGNGEPVPCAGETASAAEGSSDEANDDVATADDSEVDDGGAADHARRRREMRTAVELMDKNNRGLWTKEGEPKLKVLESIVGRPLTREEVDELIKD